MAGESGGGAGGGCDGAFQPPFHAITISFWEKEKMKLCGREIEKTMKQKEGVGARFANKDSGCMRPTGHMLNHSNLGTVVCSTSARG